MASESEKYLPTHILIDVFCRLGVECLVRCTSVCKTWHQVIHTISLANTHLAYQKTSSTTNKYVLYQDSRSCTLLTEWEALLDGTKHSELYYTPESFERDIHISDGSQLRIHGICDGLLCISHDGISDDLLYLFRREYRVGDNLHLWNPICRKAKKLPELKISKEYDWFGRKGGVTFGHYDNDYKVVVVSTNIGKYDVSVYSLSTNCWNIIHTNCYYEDKIVDFCIVMEPTKLVDGIAYMITDTFRQAPLGDKIQPLVVCFDLKDETIQQFRCPVEFNQYRTKFSMEAYGETISVLGCDDDSGNLDMWIFFRDKFSSESCWEKKIVVELQEVGHSVPVGFLNNGKYLVRTIVVQENREQITNFFLYDLESVEVTKYRAPNDYPDFLCIINSDCVESLLLLNEDSLDPFVHMEIESSCSSILFMLQNYLEKTSSNKVQNGRKQKRADKGEILKLTEDESEKEEPEEESDDLIFSLFD